MKPAQGPGHKPEKTKKARADAHRPPVRADSCLSGFWSMPCDSIPAAPSQRFLHFAAFPQRPAPSAAYPPPPAALAPFRRPLAAESPPRSPMGRKSRMEGGMRSFRQRRKLQQAGERVQGTPQARAWAAVRPSVRRFPPRSAPPKRSVFAHFRRSLAAVAAVAQALEVACVGEHSPVALVVPDVVHVRGPRPDAVPSTLATPRLPQELLTAQRLPVLRLVHPAPGLRLLTPLLGLRLVLCAVPAGHQPIAARV